MNTMDDLEREVAKRLKKSVGDREIDSKSGVTARIPHMLGITELDTVHDPHDEDDTLLDPRHQFWDEYQDSIRTRRAVLNNIQTALERLDHDGYFDVTYPYGLEEGIVYTDVTVPDVQ